MEHLELDVNGHLVGEEAGPELEFDPRLPATVGGELVSPFVTVQPVRVSAEMLIADDPAGAPTGRFQLRHSRHTRTALKRSVPRFGVRRRPASEDRTEKCFLVGAGGVIDTL